MTYMCTGESNTYNYMQYGCAMQQMVADWRYSWVTNSPTMNPRFPFGGAKHSGIGTELGQAGVEEFTQLKVLNVAR